jgi:hypothetical protein
MATCPSCGNEIKQGDWVCGHCGAPVAGATVDAPAARTQGAIAPDPYGYAPGYEPQPAAAGAGQASASGQGMSRTLLTVLVLAAVAVVAVIAVWFFFLRGNSSPFDGTWNASSSSMGAIVISGSGDDFKVKITGTDASGAKKSTAVPAHLDGADLVITVDDFVKASGDKAQVAQVKAAFEALIKDFRLVFTLQDKTHLKFTVEGTVAGGQSPNPAQRSIVLTRAD